MALRIGSLSTTGGFLEKCPTSFSSGLTCIIGARGTCKSTLVESIRFAFERDAGGKNPNTKELNKDRQTQGIIEATLGSGSVRCSVVVDDETESTSLTIEREVGIESPRVYREGIREMEVGGILHQIEVYSQGDLQRIADDDHSASRLALIDRPHAAEIEALGNQRLQAARLLRELGPRIHAIRGQIGKRREEVKTAPALADQLERLMLERPQSSPEMELSRKHFEKRKHVLSLVKDAVAARDDAIEPLASLRNTLSRLTAASAAVEDAGQPETAALGNALQRCEGVIQQILELRTELEAIPISKISQDLASSFEQLNEDFYRLRRDEQQINEALKKEEVLRKQIELIDKAEADLRNLEHQEAALLRSSNFIGS